MEQRYTALRIIGHLYVLFAALTILGGVGLGILELVTPTIKDFGTDASGKFSITYGPPNTGLGAAILIGGILLGITCLAASNFISLMIAVEENTRSTSEAMQKLANRSSSRQSQEVPAKGQAGALLRSLKD